MEYSLIVAYDKNRLIGNGNKIPWYISEDLKLFKQHTTNNIVIMGKNTHESIGVLLPDRINIIISKTINKRFVDAYYFDTIGEALIFINSKIEWQNKEVFFIGGVGIYQEAIEIVDNLYITKIHDTFEGDVYLPEINMSLFENVAGHCNPNIKPSHTFEKYKRIIKTIK